MTRIQHSRKTFGLMLAACLLAACEHKPAAPGDVVRASNEAVLQCSVDTDCMLNRVCGGGQCKLSGDSSTRKATADSTAYKAYEAYQRRSAEAACLAEAKAYMNSAVSAIAAEFTTIPAPPLDACVSPTTALRPDDFHRGASIEFVPKSPGIARSHCSASTATCVITHSDSDSAPAAMPPTAETTTTATALTTTLDQLRREAANAYTENRIYAPAGNNTVEFYLALRDQQPGDAGAVAGLNDLLPMTVTGAEQSIARGDFTEARRLIALIEKIDARHSALQRLKDSIDIDRTSARPVAPPSSPDPRPRYKPAPSPASTPRPAPQPQAISRKARYMGADGCMYEADGRPVLGFKRECDSK